MSWQSYIDNLVSNEHVEKAAIIGLDGNVWAQSSDLTVTPQEGATISAAFKKADGIRQNGIIVGGQKYFFLQSDDKQIQGRKGPCGISIAKSTQCIVIGVYGNGMQGGNCRSSVERIVDYLTSVGY